MPRLPGEHPAEALLYRMGLIRRRTVQRRALLGCIGCRWLRRAEQGEEVSTYGFELIRCTGVAPGVVYPIIGKLAELGVLTRKREVSNPTDESFPPRVLYMPADTELGKAFYAELQAPDVCDLPPSGAHG